MENKVREFRNIRVSLSSFLSLCLMTVLQVGYIRLNTQVSTQFPGILRKIRITLLLYNRSMEYQLYLSRKGLNLKI